MGFSPSGPFPNLPPQTAPSADVGGRASGVATILFKSSRLRSDRPDPGTIQIAEPAVCVNEADPGVYMINTSGALLKIGPTGFGPTAPNAVPSGAAGNSPGELWVDSSDASYKLRTWTGSAWVTIGAAGHASVVDELQTDALMISMIPEGTLVYQHTAPSGLYMRYSDGWVPC